MTWFAHHIFALPTVSVLNILTNNPFLTNRIYWIQDLTEHQWPNPQSQHGLPLDGLLVVKPVADPDGHYEFWYKDEESIISWFNLQEPDETGIDIPPSWLKMISLEYDLADYPPIPFLKWLKRLSLVTQTPSAYYHCATWGGKIEMEYAWVFTPNESAYAHTPFQKSELKLIQYGPEKRRETKDGYVLVETLKHFELELPSPYFALHSRSFPWQKYLYTGNNQDKNDRKT